MVTKRKKQAVTPPVTHVEVTAPVPDEFAQALAGKVKEAEVRKRAPKIPLDQEDRVVLPIAESSESPTVVSVRASFKVSERTDWMREHDVMQVTGCSRLALRTLAKHKMLDSRRDAEHGWWEYRSSQIYDADFRARLSAHEAAQRLNGMAE